MYELQKEVRDAPKQMNKILLRFIWDQYNLVSFDEVEHSE